MLPQVITTASPPAIKVDLQRAADLARQEKAAATRRAYGSDFQIFTAWLPLTRAQRTAGHRSAEHGCGAAGDGGRHTCRCTPGNRGGTRGQRTPGPSCSARPAAPRQ